MLFYVKKSLWLDLIVTILLGGLGYLGMQYFSVPFRFSLSAESCVQGFASFLLIMSWTFLVQKGYAVAKGQEYAKNLTDVLAKEYLGTSFFNAFFGGLTAALGEELFFRGFSSRVNGALSREVLPSASLTLARKIFASSATGPTFTGYSLASPIVSQAISLSL